MKGEPRLKGARRTMLSSCLTGIRIVVVEDNVTLRSLLTQFLLKNGATVTACGSVSEGTDKVRREQPDLVLTDLNLPDAAGLQLMTNIRRFDVESGRNTRAIAMSALGNFVADELAMAVGFCSYLPKPFSPKQLVNAIRLALELNNGGG